MGQAAGDLTGVDPDLLLRLRLSRRSAQSQADKIDDAIDVPLVLLTVRRVVLVKGVDGNCSDFRSVVLFHVHTGQYEGESSRIALMTLVERDADRFPEIGHGFSSDFTSGEYMAIVAELAFSQHIRHFVDNFVLSRLILKHIVGRVCCRYHAWR